MTLRGRAATAIVLVVSAFATTTGSAHAQDDVGTLVRRLKSRDFEQTSAAVEALRKRADARPAVVAGLIDALRTGAWDRCGGDVRDTIAAALLDLKAKDAVGPLLELVRSGKPIEHECAQ